MFVLSDDKSARAQFSGLIAELQNQVNDLSAKIGKLEADGKTRSDAYKMLKVERGTLNGTIALVMSVDVMTNGNNPSGTIVDLQPQQPTHIITYSQERGVHDVLASVATCSCGTFSTQSTSFMLVDRAVGSHLRHTQSE